MVHFVHVWRKSPVTRDELEGILACPLFAEANKSGLADDIESLPFRMTTYNPGQIILFRGETYIDLIIILSGILEATQEDEKGHHLIVETLAAPQAVASAMLFGAGPRLPVTLRSRGVSKLFRISRSALLYLCGRYQKILENLLDDMGKRATFLADKLRFQAFTSIRQKLAVFLVERNERGEEDEPVVKEALAEMFGVTRPSLSRVCQELTEHGLIRLDGRRMTILDLPGLKELSASYRES